MRKTMQQLFSNVSYRLWAEKYVDL